MRTITTVQGDTIAWRVYGNTLCTQELMEARENIRLLDVEVFPAGIVVAAPDVETPSAADGLPEWRR